MELQLAIKVQKTLSDKYLFSSSRVLELAGETEEREDFYNEYLSNAFEVIDGISIVFDRNDGEYKIMLYQTSTAFKVNAYLVSNLLQVGERDVQVELTEKFKLHSRRIRPLQIGCSVGHIGSRHYGTLGCFVQNPKGEKFVLSNYHVLFDPQADYTQDYVIQPGRPHGSERDIIGTVRTKLPIDLRGENEHDAALAGPLSDDIDNNIYAVPPVIVVPRKADEKPGERPEIAEKRTVTRHSDPVFNENVYKCGAFSATTYGHLESYLTNVKVGWGNHEIAFKNQILVKGQGMTGFSGPGDSGSIVINDKDEAVGLLIGGNQRFSLANRIGPVLAKLGVNLYNS